MGYPHPDYLLPWLDSRQLQEWQIYFAEGYDVSDLQFARLTAFVEAAAGQKTTVDKHMIWKAHREPEELSPEQTLAMMPGGAEAMQQLLDGVADRHGGSA